LFVGGSLVPAPLWITGIPLFFALLSAITLSGIPDRLAVEATGKRTPAGKFGTDYAFSIAIISIATASLLVLLLQLSPLPGKWPNIAVVGMLVHGIVLLTGLVRAKRHHRSPRIDSLLTIALSFIMWFAFTPLFASQSSPPVQTTAHELDRPPIGGDLVASNQNGETVRLSDLRGKVWAVTQFFAVCPLCARSNSTDLKTLSETFSGYPDFHLVCISIDPEQDDVGKLAAYARALGADVKKWWFLTGEPAVVHRYLEKDLKFPSAIERTDPDEIAAMGRFQHDLGIMVIDREMRIVGKRNLSWAADQSPQLRDQWEQHLHSIILNELSSKGAAR
jgi:cytochrome oxidase Cu insertion factor (SCO1/SenC/PrrC family)